MMAKKTFGTNNNWSKRVNGGSESPQLQHFCLNYFVSFVISVDQGMLIITLIGSDGAKYCMFVGV